MKKYRTSEYIAIITNRKNKNEVIRFVVDMVYCESQIKVLFREFNRLYFDNILPVPYVKIRHSVKTLGYFSYTIGAMPGTTEVIEISDFYNYTDNQLRDIIVHEMIHYYLSYTGEDIYPSHGRAFMNKARQLNRKYGLQVTPTIDLTRMKPRDDAPFLKRLYYKIVC